MWRSDFEELKRQDECRARRFRQEMQVKNSIRECLMILESAMNQYDRAGSATQAAYYKLQHW
jgi:hypothetical protein